MHCHHCTPHTTATITHCHCYMASIRVVDCSENMAKAACSISKVDEVRYEAEWDKEEDAEDKERGGFVIRIISLDVTGE